MRSGRRREGGARALPLWLKLTLANTLVVLLVALAALVGVREGLRLMLEKELEVALRDEVYEVALNAQQSAAHPRQVFDEMASTSAGHLRHGWFLQVFAADGGRCLWCSDNTPPELAAEPVVADHGEALTRRGDYYLMPYRMQAAGLPGYWVRLGTPAGFIREDVDNVTRIILPVLGVLLLLAPLGGYILATRATAPLKRIITTTERLRPNQLEDRLALRGTGDELDQLSEKINHFLDEIADHLHRNREFVANAAHELRSPLAAIESSIDVALTHPRSAADYEDLLATVQEECRQLSILVNHLLVLAESDAGCLENLMQEVPLDRLAQLSLEMFAGVAEEKGVALRGALEPGLLVLGEAARLRQVVNNLIDNAIKFTPAGGRVEVTAGQDAATREAVLSVADTGIGIPAECLPRLFDRFYQVDPSRHHETVQHGTGLGLSICRAVVHAFGGKITVRSRPGRGATFEVRLPAARRGGGAPAGGGATPPAAGGAGPAGGGPGDR